ncbi:MAG: hypothetical protein M3N47_01130 [Chloroflexota bacterium]|nr:hypothetical protein [Chloroflexota bacterium]
MKAYPVELRDRIVRAVENGLGRAELARLFAVSPRTISRCWAAIHDRTRSGCRLAGARRELIGWCPYFWGLVWLLAEVECLAAAVTSWH